MSLVTSTHSTNTDYRAVTIRNFRNLGLNHETSIVINRSIQKEQLGNIVILVGQNNSGKTNVLDAIEVASKGYWEERDIPDRSLSGTDLIPAVKFDVCDGKKNYLDYRESITAERIEEDSTTISNLFDYESIKDDPHLEDIIGKILGYYKNCDNEYQSARAKALEIYNSLSSTIPFIINNSNRGLLQSVLGADDADYWYHTLGSKLTAFPSEPKVKHLASKKTRIITPEESSFEKENGYKLTPNVVKYEEIAIKGSDLSCSPEKMNDFINNILEIIYIKTDVEIAYKIEDPNERSGVLNGLESVINKRLITISDEFNRLKVDNRFNYRFEINLKNDRITYRILMNNIELVLDKQSAGFKWFFYFYFNLIVGRRLSDGDIVILDEPATNLHVAGQVELVQFLRRYSKNLKVTFIISTHSPFFIDCDYLDEVRVVRRISDGSSIIEDKFSVIDYDNPDQMDAILKSLTIGRNVLVNSYNPCIYVEGITDYNYLVAFKILLGINDISLIPINGVGANDEERDIIIHKLLNIDRKPMLLADGDGNGLAIKKRAEGTDLSVVLLSDIDILFRTIESLFTKDELDMFDLRGKKWNNSSIFKQNIMAYADDISETTRSNFRKVIEHLKKIYFER